MAYEAKPILKWAGGKTQMLTQIIENLPTDFHKISRYVEPFVGAGAVFLHLINNNCFEEYVINDINEKLINLYRVIKDDLEGLLESLKAIKDKYMLLNDIDDKERFYYECREQFNINQENKTTMGALFIFLNKTCFNGLYRENSKGLFNVPFGKHISPGIYDENDIRAISNLLNSKNEKGEFKVKILNTTFENLYDYVDSDTFVYFDPPYRPVMVGGFNTYSKSGFNDDKQVELRDFYVNLNQKSARLMLSNSDPKVLNIEDDFFDNLYKDFVIKRVSANRMINSNGKGRGAITELLITNYECEGKMNAVYEKKAEIFDYLMSTLKESIKGWDYFVNWDKVNKNIKNIEVYLNILNYLIGKEDIEKEAKYLLKKYPEIISTIPILVACRENKFQIITTKEDFMLKNYLFDGNELSDEYIDNIVEFMKKSNIIDLLSNKSIKNVVDYVFGVEVGLDSNERKNRSGHSIEYIVGKFLERLCDTKGYPLLKEATPEVIKKEWGFSVNVDKSSRRFDFAVNAGEKLVIVETNYYRSGGSKLKATAGEYKILYDLLAKDNHMFLWIIDGEGWLKVRKALEETFYHNEYILNLTMLEDGILDKLL